MKTIYSLREFYEEAKTLAETKGIDYVAVKVEFNTHNGLVFNCYAHGYNWYSAEDPQRALSLLKADIFKTSKGDTKNDIEIDIP